MTNVDDAKRGPCAFKLLVPGKIEKRPQQGDVDGNYCCNCDAPRLKADLRLIGHCRSTPAAAFALLPPCQNEKSAACLFGHAALLTDTIVINGSSLPYVRHHGLLCRPCWRSRAALQDPLLQSPAWSHRSLSLPFDFSLFDGGSITGKNCSGSQC